MNQHAKKTLQWVSKKYDFKFRYYWEMKCPCHIKIVCLQIRILVWCVVLVYLQCTCRQTGTTSPCWHITPAFVPIKKFFSGAIRIFSSVAKASLWSKVWCILLISVTCLCNTNWFILSSAMLVQSTVIGGVCGCQ